MVKTPQTKVTSKKGRPRLPEHQQKSKVQIYLNNDIIDFINGLVDEGRAYNVTSFVVLTVNRYVNHLRQAKLKSGESQAKNQENSKKV